MKKLFHFLFAATLMLIITGITSPQEESKKDSSQTSQNSDKEFDYSGIVSWQGLSYDKNDRPDAILFRLKEYKDLNFRVSFLNSDSLGVTTESRTRIFIGSKVGVNCQWWKREFCNVTSLKWIVKEMVAEGTSHYSGTVEKVYYGKHDGVVHIFLTLAKHPDVEFWFKTKVFETSDVNWLGVLDEHGTVKIGSGYPYRIRLTCDKDETTSQCRVTSLGVSF